MNEELTREENRARRLMAMGQMAASLAHEIRNPLGSMELFCTLLKKDLVTEPEKLSLAEQIHQGIRTLDRIITNCLQFSRDIVPKRKSIDDVGQLLEEALGHARRKAEQAGLSFVIDVIDRPRVSVDPYLFSQALLNLAMNAVEAVQEKKALLAARGEEFEGRILISSSAPSADAWRIVVADNGPGIPSEVQAQIFDPFFTTKNDGTGLGLAITHSIVAAHRGRILLSSALDCGTEISVDFPSAGE